MTELISEEFLVNAQNKSNLSITSNDINIELSKEFLVKLRKSAYHGWIDEDVVNNIAKGEGKITTWEELVENFFYKFYPESYDGEEEMLDEGNNWGIDPLEFISRVNSSFGNHRRVDGRTKKALLKDEDIEEVDVHLYRSMIGSLMYLTSSRPDSMFAVCACARYQVNLKVSHLHAVKMIFRYLKGQLKLGLWYPKDSPFDLVAYTDSDYAGASLDRKSTIRVLACSISEVLIKGGCLECNGKAAKDEIRVSALNLKVSAVKYN
ncbi:hypothetical protein Tco_1134918 [Tanacetum coccineum]